MSVHIQEGKDEDHVFRLTGGIAGDIAVCSLSEHSQGS